MGYWEQIGEDNRRWRAEAPMRRARRKQWIEGAAYGVLIGFAVYGFLHFVGLL